MLGFLFRNLIFSYWKTVFSPLSSVFVGWILAYQRPFTSFSVMPYFTCHRHSLPNMVCYDQSSFGHPIVSWLLIRLIKGSILSQGQGFKPGKKKLRSEKRFKASSAASVYFWRILLTQRRSQPRPSDDLRRKVFVTVCETLVVMTQQTKFLCLIWIETNSISEIISQVLKVRLHLETLILL